MKKAVSIMAVTALVFGIGITTSFAQGRQGGMRGGPGGGPGGMFGRQSAADTVCNLLVLNAERGEKVEKALSALQEKFAESMRESFESMRDMSREERREAMQKVREEQSEEQAKALKEILSEKELKAIKPFLSAFGIRSTAELRTLRLLDLKDEQHTPNCRKSLSRMEQACRKFNPRVEPAVAKAAPVDHRKASKKCKRKWKRSEPNSKSSLTKS